MSINSNKKDFEDSLSRAKEALDKLHCVISDEIYFNINAMIVEYECHYRRDIEAMIDNNCK